MKILVINCGSSSIKYQLFQMPEANVLAKGLVEKLGEEISVFSHKSVRGDEEKRLKIANYEEGIDLIIASLIDKEHGVLFSIGEIAGVGHRVVHGGEDFTSSVKIDDGIIAKIESYSDLAPLHNPPNVRGIKAAQKLIPHAIQVACFDTAFHHSLPQHAYLYAIPFELYEKFKIRRYGFHGTSHRYVAARAAKMMQKQLDEVNLITCHLGNGCSMAAIEKGRSVDTSMGLTPLEGLVMGTRCGDIDPAVMFYLIEKGFSVEGVNDLLNRKSGLIGISGLSNDMRNLIQAGEKGNQRAQLAIDIFTYRIKKYIGAYLAVLAKTDGIVFTGGIGENNSYIRQQCLRGLERLGIEPDEQKNSNVPKGAEAQVQKEGSPVRIFVIPTNEELRIADDTFEFAKLGGE